MLRSFGCSFIYGSELADRSRTWPALLATRIGLEHVNHATEGSGNLRIMESVLNHATADDVCVIGWTWIDRFDHIDIADETWHTILPTHTDHLADFYYRQLHSQYRDMLTNLVYVKSTIDYLDSIGCGFIMTYMDNLLFESVRDDWHQSKAVTWLQHQIKPRMSTFEEMTFLEWSRKRGFAESALWHPLDDAHAAAAGVMLPVIESIQHTA